MARLLGYMATDQHGNTYHIPDEHPRKWLLNLFRRQHAAKMYVDLVAGGSRHVGWIIAGHWLKVFRVAPLTESNSPIFRAQKVII